MNKDRRFGRSDLCPSVFICGPFLSHSPSPGSRHVFPPQSSWLSLAVSATSTAALANQVRVFNNRCRQHQGAADRKQDAHLTVGAAQQAAGAAHQATQRNCGHPQQRRQGNRKSLMLRPSFCDQQAEGQGGEGRQHQAHLRRRHPWRACRGSEVNHGRSHDASEGDRDATDLERPVPPLPKPSRARHRIARVQRHFRAGPKTGVWAEIGYRFGRCCFDGEVNCVGSIRDKATPAASRTRAS